MGERKGLAAAVNTAKKAEQASFLKLSQLQKRYEASDKVCKDEITKKSSLEAGVKKQLKKCGILDESLSEIRKKVAVEKAKCDALQVTKDMETKQLSILDDDPPITATSASASLSTGSTGATGVSGTVNDVSSGPEVAPTTSFPLTIGDCSLSALAHLDKVRAQTQHGGVWKVMSEWAMNMCKQMASSAANKKKLNTNVEVACNHAKSMFTEN